MHKTISYLMKNLLLLTALMISVTLNAQYYYNDILVAREINARMKNYVAANVQSVTATGYDAQGKKTTDFNEWQEVQPDHSGLKITTRNGQNVTRSWFRFDEKTRVVNMRDSSTDAQSVTDYSYDANDNLVKIKTTMKDSLVDFDQTKERQWLYKDGKPVKLLLIVNGNDSMEYSFTLDERKNIADEMISHRGGTRNKVDYLYDPNKIYYFYDDQNRLTDITRYSAKADRLLPDYMFSYDDQGRVVRRINVLGTTKYSDYITWKYDYNEKGLRVKESLYNKQREFQGRIDYNYSLGQ